MRNTEISFGRDIPGTNWFDELAENRVHNFGRLTLININGLKVTGLI